MADSPYIIEVTDAAFASEVIERSYQVPVLVDFWAEWCQPCKMLMPLLAKLVEEYNGAFLLAKVNTEEQQEIAAQFAIRSIPTVKLWRNGEVVDEFAGALPEGALREFLSRNLPRESDKLVDQALEWLAQEDLDAADTLLTQARSSDPSNYRIFLLSAQLEMMRGELDAAEQQLNALPIEHLHDPDAVQLRAQLPFLRAIVDAPEPEILKAAAARGDSQALYQLAAYHLQHQDFEAALEQLLTLLRKDRNYADDAARKGMLAIFELLGGEGELVQRYRTRLSMALH